MTWTLVGLALDELAEAAAGAQDHPTARCALAEVVRDLEETAGAALGPTYGDPTVLLVRRLARAHRLLLRDGRTIDIHRVHRHVLALREAAAPPPPTRTPSSARVGA